MEEPNVLSCARVPRHRPLRHRGHGVVRRAVHQAAARRHLWRGASVGGVLETVRRQQHRLRGRLESQLLRGQDQSHWRERLLRKRGGSCGKSGIPRLGGPTCTFQDENSCKPTPGSFHVVQREEGHERLRPQRHDPYQFQRVRRIHSRLESHDICSNRAAH